MADCLRPLLLKNMDINIVVASLARRLRPILSKEVRQTQSGVVACRDLVRNVVGLDIFARALHTTIASDDLAVLLLFDMFAALPSVSGRWLRVVLERLGVPRAAIPIFDIL